MQNPGEIEDDTIVALATPQGQGAIGVVRVSGSNAVSICNQLFQGDDLTESSGYTVHFGTIRSGDETIDEVLVTVFKAPRSFTGEDAVEISCHGSTYILQKIIDLLIDHGCRTARPGEFTLRAFLNGKMDLSQAEAVADLIAADNSGAHKLAMKQMRGGFSEKIKELRAELIQFAALVELELDFSEEDVEFADRQRLIGLVEKLRQVLKSLIDSFTLGNVIKDGVATVIAGRPNAGKSTLLNTLLQEERAIVSDIAGTTRDTIEEILFVDGIKFRLIDTAGLRDAVDTIEAIGVKKTMERISQASLVLYVFDLSVLSPEDLKADLNSLAQGIPEVVVANKTDLFQGDMQAFRSVAAQRPFIAISSKEHQQLDQLLDLLVRQITSGRQHTEGTIISNTRHRAALIKADEALEKVLEGIEQTISGDMLATDIRLSLDALGEITGEITHEDLLEDIFSKFCIGK